MGDTQKTPAIISLNKVTVDSDDHANEIAKQSSQSPPSPSSSVSSEPSILTSIHAGYFRITMSLGAQALLWRILRLHTENQGSDETLIIHHFFKTLPSLTFLLLWCLSLLALLSLSSVYLLRCLRHFRLVRAEFSHHIGVNYLYAPWISWLILLQSAPTPAAPKSLLCQVLWWVLTVPILGLDLKIYGQWFTTEKRFLSMMANPTSQVSVMGNLAGALAAARMGWKESAVFMFSLGMAHYFVLFVTLYQRLTGGGSFPALMRPSFFLFSAAPSLASLAWSSIAGDFDTSAKMLFFLSLFLFTSLACRPALFKKSMRRFNVVWWAYSFPLTFVALAASEYSHKEKTALASLLMLLLSMLSIFVFLCLLTLTALNTNSLFRKNYPSNSSCY